MLRTVFSDTFDVFAQKLPFVFCIFKFLIVARTLCCLLELCCSIDKLICIIYVLTITV